MVHSFNVQLAQKYGIEESILMHNFYFWISKNAANNKHFYHGYIWTYNSNSAFSELFPYISKSKICRAIGHLEGEGIILKDNFNSDARDRTLWYAFSEKGIEILREHGYDVAFFKMKNCISQNEICTIQNEPTIPYNKTTDSKEKEDNKLSSKKKLSNGFVVPTTEEVSAYIEEKGYHFDAECFISFYESKGWMIGKNLMVSWKHACGTWEKKIAIENPTLFSDLDQRQRDNDSLEINGHLYR